MSPRWNPPGTKGGGGVHTRLRMRGWESPNSDDWRTSLELCLLCAVDSFHEKLIKFNRDLMLLPNNRIL